MGNAFLTGLLIGMNMPVDVAIVVPIIASAFAIFVVKWTFGGLGANWMNPALAGRSICLFLFHWIDEYLSSTKNPRKCWNRRY